MPGYTGGMSEDRTKRLLFQLEVWQVFAFVAALALSIWLVRQRQLVQEREAVLERIHSKSPQCVYTSIGETESLPFGLWLFGAEPIEYLEFDGDGVSKHDRDAVVRLLPEAKVLVFSGKQDEAAAIKRYNDHRDELIRRYSISD